MNLSADQITIAVTVYDRRDFLKESIGSALAQTVPVRVMVVEDCGPDPGLEKYVRDLFGNRIAYFRSTRRRGIFGNWNACIEQCPTPWLSILHDDDRLKPGFIEAMLSLNKVAGNKGLYFGQTDVVDGNGNPWPERRKVASLSSWAPICLADVLVQSPFPFPGQLFQVGIAKALGGFRETSFFCGEWELWSKIIASYGGAQTAESVAIFRDHRGWNRGTNRIYRSGKTHGLTAVQCKRNIALAKRLGLPLPPANLEELIRPTLPTFYLLYYAKYFPPLYLKYNTLRYTRSHAPHFSYALFQSMARLGGPRVVKLASRLFTAIRKPR